MRSNTEPRQAVRQSQDNLIESEDGTRWKISILLPVLKDFPKRNDIELCSSTHYDLSKAEELRAKIERTENLREHFAAENGILGFKSGIAVTEAGDGQYASLEFPRNLPEVLRTIIKDAILYESATDVEFARSTMQVNFRFDALDNRDNTDEEFHQDFEAYRKAATYAVASRDPTVGSDDPRALYKTLSAALEAGITIFRMLPGRMYRWTKMYIHASPDNRFEGENANKTRVIAVIGFVYP